jgi:DNA polymerase elongation subunit (family B)
MYRNIHYNNRKGTITLWTWNDVGDRTEIEVPFKPYLYVESQNYKDGVSIYNTTLRKIEFKNQFERRRYTEESGIKRIFYNIRPEQQYLIDQYGSLSTSAEFSQHPLKTFFLDIEIYSPDEFPEASQAKYPINAITIYDSITKKYYTWGLKNDYNPRENCIYVKCNDETDLLKRFLKFWSIDYCDVISGYNCESFDIPYLINRISMLLGENAAKQLSPINELYCREGVIKKFGKVESKWYIKGMSILDYMEVYKVFSRKQQESYALNYIAEAELGEGKLAYNATNLAKLSQTDWQKFIDYNIQDVNLLVMLEEKLKFLDVVRMLAYMGLTPFEAALGTISVVTGAMAVKAREKNMIIPTFNTNNQPNYEGGYVKEPNRGLKESIISFDANSLYPNTIITLNISPETKLGNIIDINKDSVSIQMVSGKSYDLPTQKFLDFVKKEKIAISKARVMYNQKSKGFCPELVEGIYKDRVELKDKLKEHKKALAHCKEGSELYDKHIKAVDHFDILEKIYKVLINRIYGTFANKYSPFCDVDAASSITLTGQACIKQGSDIVNKYYQDKYGISDCDSNIYTDTDSIVGDSLIRTSEGIFKIEDLFNFYNNDEITTTRHGHEIIKPKEKIQCLSYDDKGIKTVPIKHFIRHKVSKKKYKVKVNGKEIIMTEDHGCMVLRNNNLIRVSPKEIKKGDKMVNIYTETCDNNVSV